MDPLTIGLAAGGLASFLGGIFGNKNTPLPALQLSPDSLKSVNFSDIDLASMNPELYDEIMRNKRMLDDAEHMLENRKMGISPIERLDMERQKADVANRVSSQGLAGSSVGEGLIQEAEQRIRESIVNKSLQEQMALMQNAEQQGRNVYDMTRGGEQDIYGALNANRMASLNRDEMANNRNMAQYNADMQNQAAKNQFFSGLGGSLLNLAGQNYNMGRLSGLNKSIYGVAGPIPYAQPSLGYFNSPSYPGVL